MSEFRGMVVLITGGTSGIGLALAEALLGAGALVAVCARSSEALQAFQQMHPEALAVRGDVTDATSQASILDAVEQRFGRLDIFISNAGILVEHAFGGDWIEPAALAAEITLNLTAPIQLTAAVLSRFPELVSLVFVTSGYSLSPTSRSPTYSAAKAGLRAFIKGLRLQLGGKVHLLEVLPPMVDTPSVGHQKAKKVSPKYVADEVVKALAGRRDEALIGSVRLLPLLLRVAPKAVERYVAKT